MSTVRNWQPFANVSPNARGLKRIGDNDIRVSLHKTRKEVDGVTVRIGIKLAERMGWKVRCRLLPVQSDGQIAIVESDSGWRAHAAYACKGTAKEHKGQVRNLVVYFVLPADVRKLFCPTYKPTVRKWTVEDKYLVLMK